MKKLALLSTLLSLGLFVTGCGETSKPKPPAPVNPPMNTGTPPAGEPDATTGGEEMPAKEGDESATETPAEENAPADGDKTDKDAPADEK